MSATKIIATKDTRKTFDVRPSQEPVDFEKLMNIAIERFPKVHAILAK